MENVLRVLRILGGENRLRIVRLLMQEELCVQELEYILGISQPAISQQVRLLRESGIATTRRIGNWIFYSVDREQMLAVLEEIMGWIRGPVDDDPMKDEWKRLETVLSEPLDNCPRPPRKRAYADREASGKGVIEIRFICTGNSARSIMAEYLTRTWGDSERISVASAGVEPQGVNPMTGEVMDELGIDVRDARSNPIDSEDLYQSDIIITVCSYAREHCPETPPGIQRRHWDIPDPTKEAENSDDTRQAFREAREEITRRVRDLLLELDAVADDYKQSPL